MAPLLRMLGSPRRCCDGITRRETLAAGALTFFGGALDLPSLLAAESAAQSAAARRAAKAKNVIVLYLLGGAATQDMYDLKPDAPVGIKSEFNPISTDVPGVQVCEHLPLTARWMHRTALIRSLNHKAGCHNCLPSYSGFEQLMPDQNPRASDPPSMGSVCEYLEGRTDPNEVPAYVYMPNVLGWGQNIRRAGPFGGYLGNQFDAFTTECEPKVDAGVKPLPGTPGTVRGAPMLPNSALPSELTIDRFNHRKDLLRQIDDEHRRLERSGAVERYSDIQKRAFGVLGASKLTDAFNLTKEPAKLVERYGNTLFGNSALVARRLIERGARFVNVTFDLYHTTPGLLDYDAWDTHTKNFQILKNNKLPGFDQTFTALLEDLDERGLLDETLIVVTSEMGRTPRINANAGRDHWTYCYSTMFAGAGIRGGTVCGASDAQAAFVKDRPVSPADICATVFECLGIDPEMMLPDRSGRPSPAAQGGRAIHEILA